MEIGPDNLLGLSLVGIKQFFHSHLECTLFACITKYIKPDSYRINIIIIVIIIIIIIIIIIFIFIIIIIIIIIILLLRRRRDLNEEERKKR